MNFIIKETGECRDLTYIDPDLHIDLMRAIILESGDTTVTLGPGTSLIAPHATVEFWEKYMHDYINDNRELEELVEKYGKEALKIYGEAEPELAEDLSLIHITETTTNAEK